MHNLVFTAMPWSSYELANNLKHHLSTESAWEVYLSSVLSARAYSGSL